MLPFVILVNEGNKERLLQDIAQKIDEIPEQKTRQIIGAATYVLAGLVLDKNIIKQILRRDIMRESVTYQEILEEGEFLDEPYLLVAYNFLGNEGFFIYDMYEEMYEVYNKLKKAEEKVDILRSKIDKIKELAKRKKEEY